MILTIKHKFSKAIKQGSNLSSAFNPSVYFLEGLDPRKLSSSQQIQISKFTLQNPQGDSFMVFNKYQLVRKIRNWNDKLPWIKSFYAMKANPLPQLCQQVIRNKLGMDCASKKEIEQSLELGIDPKDIVYANSIKNQKDLKWAYQNNIKLSLADTKKELIKMKELAPEMKILWRISIEEPNEKNLYFRGFSSKFGDDLRTDEDIHRRMKEIKEMGVKLQGIHFHSGSTRLGSTGFAQGIELARKCMKIGREYGHKMEIMDVGGGFPSVDLTNQDVKEFESTRNDPLGYQIFAQPGRYFCDNMFYVCSRVIGQRQKYGISCYHINQSIFHTFSTVYYQSTNFSDINQFYGKVTNGESKQIKQRPQSITLFGMTLDGTDIISTDVKVPCKLQIGDWLVFGGLGAYSSGMITKFNGMQAITKIYTWEGDVQKQRF